MLLLAAGIVIFLGVHLLPTFPHLRERLVDRLGENGYRGVFSLLSLFGFLLIVWGFAVAPVVQVWSPPTWTRYAALVLMLPVFVLIFAAYLPGVIKQKVKHPFLVAIKTWALAHLISNGDLASIILFGSFLAYAVYDRIAVKRRAETGLVTVSGPGSPRNDIISIVGGTAAYVIFLIWLHPLLIGKPALP